MNNSYNYSDFSGVSLSANNELESYRSQPKLKQKVTHSQQSPSEKRIDNMLLSHNKCYVNGE